MEKKGSELGEVIVGFRIIFVIRSKAALVGPAGFQGMEKSSTQDRIFESLQKLCHFSTYRIQSTQHLDTSPRCLTTSHFKQPYSRILRLPLPTLIWAPRWTPPPQSSGYTPTLATPLSTPQCVYSQRPIPLTTAGTRFLPPTGGNTVHGIKHPLTSLPSTPFLGTSIHPLESFAQNVS